MKLKNKLFILSTPLLLTPSFLISCQRIEDRNPVLDKKELDKQRIKSIFKDWDWSKEDWNFKYNLTFWNDLSDTYDKVEKMHEKGYILDFDVTRNWDFPDEFKSKFQELTFFKERKKNFDNFKGITKENEKIEGMFVIVIKKGVTTIDKEEGIIKDAVIEFRCIDEENEIYIWENIGKIDIKNYRKTSESLYEYIERIKWGADIEDLISTMESIYK